MYVRDICSNAPLLAARNELDFFHQDRCLVSSRVTAFESYCGMTDSSSQLLRTAFWLRDRFCALAGVRPINGFAQERPKASPVAGDVVDFFKVDYITNDELFLVANDRHLCVLVALMLSPALGSKRELTITASVKTHNLFGKVYMVPVAYAHGLIVRRMLRQLTSRA
ncbi:DUF2867 domain-containing protein [Paraburkholderia sp. MM5384-R2]|uniref:DUF2867 domain-containing protein n=1 Tax=Paraburkholderia sp. MM5384-R2 TaxID=2723097 RepID=UPI0028899CCD|nr:DUF2867 domain-containing protein [Paraburkholderia sp. MM5384-R2]